jgi:hypothetical protein
VSESQAAYCKIHDDAAAAIFVSRRLFLLFVWITFFLVNLSNFIDLQQQQQKRQYLY